MKLTQTLNGWKIPCNLKEKKKEYVNPYTDRTGQIKANILA